MMHTSVDLNRLDAVMGQYGVRTSPPIPEARLPVPNRWGEGAEPHTGEHEHHANGTLPGRSALSFRVDIINLPNRTTFANPNLNPASTDFGRITSATAASPRFLQFLTKWTF